MFTRGSSAVGVAVVTGISQLFGEAVTWGGCAASVELGWCWEIMRDGAIVGRVLMDSELRTSGTKVARVYGGGSTAV